MSPEATIVASRVLGLLTDLQADLEALDKLHGDVASVMDEPGASLPPKARAAMLAVALHGYYCAVESALGRITRDLDGSTPSGADWHRTLLERAGREVRELRPAVLGTQSVAMLRRLLGFRHFFRHAYAVELDLTLLEGHAAALLAAHDSVVEDLRRFLDHLQAAADAVPSADGS